MVRIILVLLEPWWISRARYECFFIKPVFQSVQAYFSCLKLSPIFMISLGPSCHQNLPSIQFLVLSTNCRNLFLAIEILSSICLSVSLCDFSILVDSRTIWVGIGWNNNVWYRRCIISRHYELIFFLEGQFWLFIFLLILIGRFLVNFSIVFILTALVYGRITLLLKFIISVIDLLDHLGTNSILVECHHALAFFNQFLGNWIFIWVLVLVTLSITTQGLFNRCDGLGSFVSLL